MVAYYNGVKNYETHFKFDKEAQELGTADDEVEAMEATANNIIEADTTHD